MILFLQLATLDHPGHFEHAPADAVDKRAPRWRPFGGPQYFHAPELVRAIATYRAATEIVVTDWGTLWPDIARNPALPRELRARFIDTLWLLDLEDYRSDLVDVFGSIQFWLKHRRPEYKGPWLCIGTKYHAWPVQERRRLIGGGGWSHPQLRADLERNLHDAYATAGIAPDLGGSA